MCIWANRRPHGNVGWVVLTKFDTLFCFVFVYFLVAYLICITISGIDMHDDCPTIVYILRTLLFYLFTLKTEFGFFSCVPVLEHFHTFIHSASSCIAYVLVCFIFTCMLIFHFCSLLSLIFLCIASLWFGQFTCFINLIGEV